MAVAETPEKIALKWIGLMEARKPDQSYATASARFRRSISEREWEARLALIRDPLGDVRSRTLISETRTRELAGLPDGEYVLLVFATVFQNKAAARERVTLMREDDGKMRPTAYRIR